MKFFENKNILYKVSKYFLYSISVVMTFVFTFFNGTHAIGILSFPTDIVVNLQAHADASTDSDSSDVSDDSSSQGTGCN